MLATKEAGKSNALSTVELIRAERDPSSTESLSHVVLLSARNVGEKPGTES